MDQGSKMFRTVVAPLNTYDYLGYLAPGGALLLSTYLFELWARAIESNDVDTAKLHTPVWTTVSLLRPASEDWVLSFLFLVSLVAVCYLAGHIVASVSAIAIDRTFVARGYGYPMFNFLRLEDKTGRRNPAAANYYRGLFFWVNLYLVMRYGAIFFEGPTRPLGVALALEWAANIVGWVVAISVPIKIIASIRFAPDGTLRSGWAKKKFAIPVIDWANRILMYWPWFYDHLAEFFSRYLLTRQPASEEFLKLYEVRFREKFGLSYADANTDNYWFCYLYMRDHSGAISATASNWLQIYSFARNLAAAFYVFFVYAFGWLVVHQANVITWDSYRVKVLLAAPLAALVVAGIMLVRYYYLYASYFTKWIFRAFLYLSSPAVRNDK